MSVGEAKEVVTSTEFLRWLQVFEDEWSDQDRTIYQLAQIAYQIYLLMFMFGGEPGKTLEDFILEFGIGDGKKDKIRNVGDSLAKEANEVRDLVLGQFGSDERRKATERSPPPVPKMDNSPPKPVKRS